MRAFPVKPTVARRLAVKHLSKLMYPGGDRQIGRTTLWRWCRLAEIPMKLSEFSYEQCGRLAEVANLRRQGYGYNQIENQLDKTNDSRQSNQHKQSSQQRSDGGTRSHPPAGGRGATFFEQYFCG